MENHYRRTSFRAFGVLILSILCLTLQAMASEEQKSGMNISLKLTGGMGFLWNAGGDLEKARQGTVDYFSDLGSLPGYSSYAYWDKKPFLPALEADIIFQLSPHFGIGVGSGYLTFRSQGTYGVMLREGFYVAPSSYFSETKMDYHQDYKFRAVPVRMSLYGYIPSGPWNFYGHAGIGYYFGHLTDDATVNLAAAGDIFSPMAPDQRNELTGKAEISEDVKKNALGFDGGIGVAYKFGPGIEFGFEFFARAVEFSGWNGSSKASMVSREKHWTSGLGWSSETTTTEFDDVTGLLYYS
jgi:hypothetical protein